MATLEPPSTGVFGGRPLFENLPGAAGSLSLTLGFTEESYTLPYSVMASCTMDQIGRLCLLAYRRMDSAQDACTLTDENLGSFKSATPLCFPIVPPLGLYRSLAHAKDTKPRLYYGQNPQVPPEGIP